MQFYQIIGVIICAQIIQYVSTLESTHPNISKEQTPVEYPDLIIETILHHLDIKKSPPINITQISSTVGYSQQKIHSAIDSIKGQHVYFFTEKILSLRSTIDVVFDTIGQIINSLESSLDSTICLADFGLLDVQIALQVMMDVCISSNWENGESVITDVQTFSNETVASSVYCLSSEIKSFIISASSFAKITSNKKVDGNVISGVQAIVESVLNIVEMVLKGLKEMKGQERVFSFPSLIELTSTIGKLTSQRFNLIDGFADDIISSLTMVANTTQSSMENLPLIMDANIAKLIKSISDHDESIPNFNGTLEPIKSLQSDLRELSKSVHSIYKASVSVFAAYSLDISSQNLIATITYLTYSVALLPSDLIYIREFHELIEPNFQANLLYITSNIRTLSDEVALIVQRRLIDLICTSSPMKKTNLKTELTELQSFVETIISVFEKVVKSLIKTVRSQMSCVSSIEGFYNDTEYDDEGKKLFKDTKLFITDLDLILNAETTVTPSTNDNGFEICSKSFAEVAQSSKKLRMLFNKSTEQINRYLL